MRINIITLTRVLLYPPRLHNIHALQYLLQLPLNLSRLDNPTLLHVLLLLEDQNLLAELTQNLLAFAIIANQLQGDLLALLHSVGKL